MTESTGPNSRSETERKILDQFSDDQRSTVTKLWDASAPSGASALVSDEEIENALATVHRRLEFSDESQPASTILRWQRMLAAAVLLIVLGSAIYLFIPNTVSVPYGEQKSLTLPDGSTIALNSGSELTYNLFFSYFNRSVLLDGEAYFSVESDDTLPFIVQTGNANIRVTGTEFNIRAWHDDPAVETEVAVAEGQVQFYPAEQEERSIMLKAGESSRFNATLKKPAAPQPVDTSRIAGWRKQMLVFNNKSLQVIFNELERRYDVSIRLESNQWAGETLTTYYNSPPAIDSVLNDICQVKGLKYAKTANGYRVYH